MSPSDDQPQYPTSLGTSDATTIRLLGQDLSADLMGKVSFGELLRRFRLEAPAPFDPVTDEFAPTIRTWTTNRYPELARDAWLDDAFKEATEDVTSRLFDEVDVA